MRNLVGPLALVVAACASPPPSAAPVPPPPASVAPVAFLTFDAPPPASAAANDPPRPPALGTPEGASAFLGEMCRHAKADDASWLIDHLRRPLFGQEWVGDGSGDGDPLVGGVTTDRPIDVASLPICKAGAPSPASITVDRDRASFTLDGRPYVAVFATSPREELVELSYVPPTAEPPKPKKRPRKHIVDGNVVRPEGDTRAFGALRRVLAELDAHPKPCVIPYAARETTSAALFVHVEKRDGEAATIRVFASSAVRASIVRCLDDQLTSFARDAFRGDDHVFADLIVRVGLPMTEAERKAQGDVPTLTATGAP